MLILPLAPQEKIRNDFLKAEYDKGGVPVFEITYREWKKKFYRSGDDDYELAEDFMGVYHNEHCKVSDDLPKRFILINRSMSNSWRLSTYYHELGHHTCVKVGCTCAKSGFVHRPTELHAELAALFLATERGFKQMTFNMITDTIRDLDHAKFNWVWNATHMVKHPVFIKAKNMNNELLKEFLDRKSNKHLKEKYLNAIVDDSIRMCRWTPARSLLKFVAK